MAEASSSSGGKRNETDENALTMLEVLEVEQELEEDANAVLGGSDDQHCTYSRGYVKRQALYACITCIPDSAPRKKGGICLACSYQCHEGHDLVELYTKRNFRCDCGNSNYPSKCTLQAEKDPVNSDNSYNDNFFGIYCTCKRPYPDPDDDTDDEMIQCIVCEDWFHGRHLGNSPPSSNFSEMVCSTCMSRHPFLKHYLGYSVKCKGTSDCEKKETQKEMFSVEELNGKPEENEEVGGVSSSKDVTVETKDSSVEAEEGKKGVVTHEAKNSKEYTDGCKLKYWEDISSSGATFWTQNWRKILCTCQKCKDMYEVQKVSFLLDGEDPVQVYEEEGKAKDSASQYEEGLRALSSLGHVQKVDAIQEYNMMQTHLKNYLKKFAENKKVVREEDIREFFSEMETRKKQRAGVHIPHFCH